MKRIIAAAVLVIMILALSVPAFADDGYALDLSEIKIENNVASGFGHVIIPEGASYSGLWVRVTMCYVRNDGTTHADVYAVPAYKSFGFPYTNVDHLVMASAVLIDNNSVMPDWAGSNLTGIQMIYG